MGKDYQANYENKLPSYNFEFVLKEKFYQFVTLVDYNFMH